MNWSNLANIAQVLAVFVFPVFFFGGRLVWKKVKAELSPNHGSSLRDAVDRIEKCVEQLVKDQKKHKKAIRRVTEDLEQHLYEVE